MPLFPPSEHKSCFAILLNDANFHKIPPNPQNTIFSAFLQFSFCSFSSFLFVFLKCKTGKNPKMPFSFRKPHFWQPDNFAKTLFWHPYTLSAILKTYQNTINVGKISKTNLGPVKKKWKKIYIYIDIYIDIDIDTGCWPGIEPPPQKKKLGSWWTLYTGLTWNRNRPRMVVYKHHMHFWVISMMLFFQVTTF